MTHIDLFPETPTFLRKCSVIVVSAAGTVSNRAATVSCLSRFCLNCKLPNPGVSPLPLLLSKHAQTEPAVLLVFPSLPIQLADMMTTGLYCTPWHAFSPLSVPKRAAYLNGYGFEIDQPRTLLDFLSHLPSQSFYS